MRNSTIDLLAKIGAIVFVAAICAVLFVVMLPKGVDHDRSDEEVALLKADNDGDGFCAHERECVTEDILIGDCDDTNKLVHPNALEEPAEYTPFFGDDIDNDCDGIVDENAIDVDNDGDGYCEYEVQCRDDSKPGDCDDSNPGINPLVQESEDNIDNDCDGIVDEGTRIFDDDGDGQSEQQGDCNDADAGIYPGSPEGEVYSDGVRGDGIDNDCDGLIDEGTLSYDDDGDGYCDHETECIQEGVKPGDCTDEDKLIAPGASELSFNLICGEQICVADGLDPNTYSIKLAGTGEDLSYLINDQPLAEYEFIDTTPDFLRLLGVDNDCDDIADNNTAETDDDGDGYCEHTACRTPKILPGDCDDTNPDIHPGAREGVRTEKGVSGDNIDNDCDGFVDEGTLNEDLDKDGHPRATDCDDTNPLVYPGAPEWVDGYDNDCDDLLDSADKLADIPQPATVDFGGPVFQVYDAAIFDERAHTWAYDHKMNIAKVDWETGVITVLKSREAAMIFERGHYTIKSVSGDEVYFSYEKSEGDGRPVKQDFLLQFDERRQPMRVALVINEPPRPAILVTSGRPIDGLINQGHDGSTVLNESPAGDPAIKLTDNDPKLTALVFYLCADDGCGGRNKYFGHFLMEPIVPSEVWSRKPATIEVDTIDTINLTACRESYSRASQRVGTTDLEQSFLAVQKDCVTPQGTEHLEFQLIFTR